MQGGFIGGLKENLKAFKQEMRGADVFDEPVKFEKPVLYDKKFMMKSEVHSKDFKIETKVYEKKAPITTKIYNLKETLFKSDVKNYTLGIKTEIKNYEFVNPEVNIEKKALEKFIIITKAKVIELTKKTKVKNIPVNRFRIKTYEGTDKIRKIPAIIEGRRFLSNKELIDLAVKVKTERTDLNFLKYNFKVVFENLPIDLIDDFQYLADSVQLKVYYKKYSKIKSQSKKLVILVEKNSLVTEKIFV